jgi:hypothetical protein
MHATDESGRWICVESRVKLNTPGKKDGLAALWVDGFLDTIRTNLDFIGSYTGPGASVNAVFLEAYWNEGSPVKQFRWYDDFVVSTKPIGPLTADGNPVLLRVPDPDCAKWEVQIAYGPTEFCIIWRSKILAVSDARVRAGRETGQFEGNLAQAASLTDGRMYFCRARQSNTHDEWSGWSAWHQPFFVVGGTGKP